MPVCKLNPRRKAPEWLFRERDPNSTSKHMLRSIAYYRALWAATPRWLSDEHIRHLKQVYKDCTDRRERGEDVVVDHIVPIKSKEVCGLNVPWNIDIIGARQNSQKSNKYWPDRPFDQQELFNSHEQLELV